MDFPRKLIGKKTLKFTGILLVLIFQPVVDLPLYCSSYVTLLLHFDLLGMHECMKTYVLTRRLYNNWPIPDAH